MSGKTRMVWTRQHPAVWEELKAAGRYIVREEAIRIKNGDMADFYLEIYRWYKGMASRYIPCPPQAEYPVWVSLSRDNMLQPVEGTVTLALEVPEDLVLVTDVERWGYRVNQWYIPLDAEDEARHDQELRRYGIANESALISGDLGNFYPLLRRKIMESWDRLFLCPPDPGSMAQGCLWELKLEWLREASTL